MCVILICRSRIKLKQEHVQIAITENIEKIKAIAKIDVINPFGGQQGNLEQTISGHENSLIAK
jgi:hypothetical protein